MDGLLSYSAIYKLRKLFNLEKEPLETLAEAIESEYEDLIKIKEDYREKVADPALQELARISQDNDMGY